jgi:hypothetical protein
MILFFNLLIYFAETQYTYSLMPQKKCGTLNFRLHLCLQVQKT